VLCDGLVSKPLFEFFMPKIKEIIVEELFFYNESISGVPILLFHLTIQTKIIYEK
jgi:hypothetical protein